MHVIVTITATTRKKIYVLFIICIFSTNRNELILIAKHFECLVRITSIHFFLLFFHVVLLHHLLCLVLVLCVCVCVCSSLIVAIAISTKKRENKQRKERNVEEKSTVRLMTTQTREGRKEASADYLWFALSFSLLFFFMI